VESVTWLLAATSVLDVGLNLFRTALGLGLVIFFHELGHFAVAKWCGVYVERFSIGFPPVLFSWKWGETEYALCAIPFGGYVKMLGQDDMDPSQLSSEEIAEDPRSYSAKPVWQRMAIISAGVTMNALTAIVFFAIAFGLGVPVLQPVVGEALPGMPAWTAGIGAGDKIEKINGRNIGSFNDVSLNTALSDDKVRIVGVHPNKQTFEVTLDPFTSKTDPDITRPQVGLVPARSLELANDKVPDVSPVVSGTQWAEAEPHFERGDRIEQFNGQPVSSFPELQELVARRDEPAEVVVARTVGEGPAKKTEQVAIRVGVDHFRRLGLRMDCSPISALQEDSPAQRAGLKVGDKLLSVNGLKLGTDLDPLKLPNEFANWAGQETEVRIKRQKESGGTEELTVKITPDDNPGWVERPEAEGVPLSVPAIGIAFHIIPKVMGVDEGSPAAQAGIKSEARIKKMTLVLGEGQSADDVKDKKLEISLFDEKDKQKDNNWAYAFWLMQELPERNVVLTVQEGDKINDYPLVPERDADWPLPVVGLRMMMLSETKQANTIGEAFTMALDHTRASGMNIYLTLRSLVTGRLSIKELHGPVGIASAAYYVASEGIGPLLLFLGFLSVNLAVLNFLPIPVLDGGHMVFLIWESITRKKPSEKVLAGATYAGMIFLLGLMALVLYLDLFVHKHGFGR
jgi:regulator of sigma E protease